MALSMSSIFSDSAVGVIDIGRDSCEGMIADLVFAPESTRVVSLVFSGCATLDSARQIMIYAQA